MKTKEKILNLARQLFNEQGVHQVSAKTIATHLNISDGNLRYHFRTKEDIVYGLYMRLVDRLNQEFEQRQTHTTLASMVQALRFTFAQFNEYRFLLLDFTSVMRQYPTVRTHYQELHRARQQQFSTAVRTLTETGVLRSDIDTSQYHRLATHLTIISDAWLAHAEILYQTEVANSLMHFTHLTFSLLFPYLTEAGQQEYHALVSRLDN